MSEQLPEEFNETVLPGFDWLMIVNNDKINIFLYVYFIFNIILLMSWKTVLVSSNKKFSLKNGFLLLSDFDDKENIIRISLEDIDLVLIENIKSILTVATIIEFSKRNITLVISDQKHEPSSLLIPISSHHKPLKNFMRQIEINSRNKNILHKQLIQSKINNQKVVLENIGSNEDVLYKMNKYSNDMVQGDKTNREAVSARLFFREIYGSSFLRFSDDGINSFINFGYKILASRISNSLIKYGLQPALGIFHKSQENYFNLSYDFIEPLRPLVDWLANYLSIEINSELTIPLKMKILRILDMKVFIDNKIYRVRNCIDIMIKSYVSYLEENTEKLLLPTIYIEQIEEQIENGEFPEF